MNQAPKHGELAPTQAQTPTFTQSEFRHALGQFATGVTVVTACNPDGGWVGLTVSSFNSVSLAPPLVLWSLALKSSSMLVLRACSHYAINVLSANQTHLSNQFATKNIDRFAGVAWSAGHHGAPLIDGAVATFECFNRSRHEEGDHVIFVGEVERCSYLQAASPLLYHGGQFYTHAIHTKP